MIRRSGKYFPADGAARIKKSYNTTDLLKAKNLYAKGMVKYSEGILHLARLRAAAGLTRSQLIHDL